MITRCTLSHYPAAPPVRRCRSKMQAMLCATKRNKRRSTASLPAPNGWPSGVGFTITKIWRVKPSRWKKQVSRLKDSQTELTAGTPWRLEVHGDAVRADRLLEMEKSPRAAGARSPRPVHHRSGAAAKRRPGSDNGAQRRWEIVAAAPVMATNAATG